MIKILVKLINLLNQILGDPEVPERYIHIANPLIKEAEECLKKYP